MARESWSDRRQRLSVVVEAQRRPDPVVLQGALRLLLEYRQKPTGKAESEAEARELAPAARYLAGAVTAFAESKRARTADRHHNPEEIHSFREQEAAALVDHAAAMLAILEATASQTLFPPAIETPLRASLLALVEAHRSQPPAGEAADRRAAAREAAGITPRGGKANRERLRHALCYAWEIATGCEIERRKRNADQQLYGKFHAFLRAALDLTGETNDLSADELWREITGGKGE
ncbi:hypothetical protein [Azotobacter beijerinckii]|uniref:Uncharacterized protein n=2 Tax=Azotobacter beijerinckii TaxID=170623 RepID=A0A1I4FIA3_9GAMM|nr:hypothetical protein [Azotobacter beijerinckii]SFB52064.1 hypothetical protein SAMN04244571_03469 [Azotobacter beijerinckii]SFL16556.1 hypothetical protein SAMN04244574_03363 [Azotobacter beijerinckii]